MKPYHHLLLIVCLVFCKSFVARLFRQKEKTKSLADVLRYHRGITDDAAIHYGACVSLHCEKETTDCLNDESCLDALECNAGCVDASDYDTCNLNCELNYGYQDPYYSNLLECMVHHGCLPMAADDGKCLGTDADADQSLTHLEQIQGKWWLLKGLNCGQDDVYYGGVDWYPCTRDLFSYQKSKMLWNDELEECGGSNSTCATAYFVSNANVTLKVPGVLHYDFTDVPLLPQVEERRILALRGDWMLYVYCGTTPFGNYAGGGVASRTSRTISSIPRDIEIEFTLIASKFGFSYQDMCISDNTQCTD